MSLFWDQVAISFTIICHEIINNRYKQTLFVKKNPFLITVRCFPHDDTHIIFIFTLIVIGAVFARGQSKIGTNKHCLIKQKPLLITVRSFPSGETLIVKSYKYSFYSLLFTFKLFFIGNFVLIHLDAKWYFLRTPFKYQVAGLRWPEKWMKFKT